MNQPIEPQPGDKGQQIEKGLKAVAIDLFKKSQRLPPISLLMRKRGKGGAKQAPWPQRPPHAFEFADFYHM